MLVKVLRMTDYEDQTNTFGLVNAPELAVESVIMAIRSFESTDAVSMRRHGVVVRFSLLTHVKPHAGYASDLFEKATRVHYGLRFGILQG